MPKWIIKWGHYWISVTASFKIALRFCSCSATNLFQVSKLGSLPPIMELHTSLDQFFSCAFTILYTFKCSLINEKRCWTSRLTGSGLLKIKQIPGHISIYYIYGIYYIFPNNDSFYMSIYSVVHEIIFKGQFTQTENTKFCIIKSGTYLFCLRQNWQKCCICFCVSGMVLIFVTVYFQWCEHYSIFKSLTSQKGEKCFEVKWATILFNNVESTVLIPKFNKCGILTGFVKTKHAC